jgi:hypothetical protein
MRCSAAVFVAAAVATSGCASLEQPEVERVAAEFARPGADPVQRCALLVPAAVLALEHDEQAPCAEALGQVELPGGEVVASQVWGDNAQVRLTGDTVFLTSTGQGWRVVAAGCRSPGEGPYLCRVEA